MTTLPQGVTSLLVDGERVLPQGYGQALVKSKSHQDEWHSVEWDDDQLDWVCTCISYQCRHRCRHSRAISRFAGGKADVRWARDEED